MRLLPSRVRWCEAVAVAALLPGAMIYSGHAQSTVQRTAELAARTRHGIGRIEGPEPVGVAFRRKIDSIIVPSIEFRSTTLEDAIEFLRQESRRLDLDPDMDARGVNILLRLPAVIPTPVGSQTTVQASQTNSMVLSANPLFDPPVPSTRPRITLTMNRIPLLEALKYVAIQAGLKVRVDPYAISLVPLEENTDSLITAVFHVSPTFLDNKSNGSGTSALNQGSTSAH